VKASLSLATLDTPMRQVAEQFGIAIFQSA
jgi:hypothetical protein